MTILLLEMGMFVLWYAYAHCTFVPNTTYVVGKKATPAPSDAIWIIGNSHPECDIHPTDDQYVNLARSNEAMFYTTKKANALLRHATPKALVIECSAKLWNTAHWILNDLAINKELNSYWPLLQFQDHAFLFKHNPKAYIKKQLTLNPFFFRHSFDGGFKPLNHVYQPGESSPTRFVDEETLEANQSIKLDYPLDVQRINFLALLKFIEEHPTLPIILVEMPVHPTYTPDMQAQQVFADSLPQLLHFNHVKRLTFSDWKMDRLYWADPEHMNQQGADLFTPHFILKVDSVLETFPLLH